MLIINRLEENNDLWLTKSDSGYYIKHKVDRMLNEPSDDALYEEAVDIDVNGQPRYEYEETNILIENEEQEDESNN